MGSRSKARKAAFDLLYEAEQRNRGARDALASFDTREATRRQGLSEADYVRSILEGIATEGKAIDTAIGGALRGWTLERLYPVDRAILRIAVWELLYSETPTDVVRSEALGLASEYGSDDATSFIGGVLGTLAASR